VEFLECAPLILQSVLSRACEGTYNVSGNCPNNIKCMTALCGLHQTTTRAMHQSCASRVPTGQTWLLSAQWSRTQAVCILTVECQGVLHLCFTILLTCLYRGSCHYRCLSLLRRYWCHGLHASAGSLADCQLKVAGWRCVHGCGVRAAWSWHVAAFQSGGALCLPPTTAHCGSQCHAL
jgi:hypothetical protein